MSWLRRLLLLAGLVTGAWLLGSAGQAHADVRVEIDQLGIEIRLPVADVGLKIETGLVPQQPQAPRPPVQDPRTEPPAPPVAPRTPPRPVADVPAPVQTEVPQQQHTPPSPPTSTTPPTNPAPVPQQPQPQAEPPVTGTLPQSGAGQAGSANQIPAGTLPNAMRPPTATTSLVSTEQLDTPRSLRAEEPTFSPD